MDFSEVVLKRRMVRHFSSEPVGAIPVGHRAQDKLSGSLKRGREAEEDYGHYEQC